MDKVGHLERHGGCGGFEVNGEAWKETKSGSLVEYLLNERVTLLGHQPGKGWKIAYRKTRYGIWVLKLKWDKDELSWLAKPTKPEPLASWLAGSGRHQIIHSSSKRTSEICENDGRNPDSEPTMSIS